MKKIIMSVAVIAAVTLSAGDVKSSTDGTFNGQLKVMHILSDKTNNFTPETGSGYLATLGYTSANLGVKGLKASGNFYINGDTGFTDWTPTNNPKVAQGMFTRKDGVTSALLGQAYLKYNSDLVDAKVGRQILNTPLTTIQWSLMPNFYQAAIATYKPMKSLSLTALYTNRMAYGSRTATDFSLIGEKTGTAGVTTAAIGQGKGTRAQAKFLNFGDAAGVADTNGMSALNVTYKMGKNLKVSLWDYIAYDISNTIYADVVYKMPVMKGTMLSLNAQYLKQSETGDGLADDINFNMYGAKANVGNKKWSAYLAYNKSNDNDNGGQFFNAFGADPAYTSSIFSRNAYRQDVSAYKIGGHYTIQKGLKIKVSHADYGQSKTKGWKDPAKGTLSAVTDATETDIVIIYKPTKALMFKIFNAIRTSEYDGAKYSTTGASGGEKQQNHFRAIASYKF